MRTTAGAIMNAPGGGCSAIFGPDGRKITEDILDTEESIIYANLNIDDILKARAFVDVCGHYSRPDILWLGVDSATKPHVKGSGEIAN